MGVTVRGAKETIAAFTDYVERFADEDLAREILTEACEPIAERMRENLAPHHRSGETEADIAVMDDESPAPGVAVVAVGLSKGKDGRDFVGRFLEDGTIKQAASPWARPAVDAEAPRHLDRLAEGYRKRLNRG